MKAKIHLIFRKIDEFFNLEKGTSKQEIKKHLEIESIAKLERDELIYLLRYCDNILLINGIDIDEK